MDLTELTQNDSMSQPVKHFAERLNQLLEVKRKPDGTKYSQTEIIAGTQGVLTRVYLWKLRKGRASNPGFHVIKAIADFFKVDPSYFFEDDDRATPKAALVIENELVKQIALRSSLLDEDGKKHILDLIEFILKISGKG
jgi:transcriptional regulator with XRE-family HTH domain